jgi:hypothetical protein
MIEVLVIAGLAGAAALRVVAVRRAALRRARSRAEAVLDELAGAACDALAADDRSRRSARAVERYARTRDRVAAARTCRELDAIVARHQLRLEAHDLVDRCRRRVRAALAGLMTVRRST